MKFLFIAPLPNSGASILLKSLNSSEHISTLLPDPNNPVDLKKFSFPTGEGEYSIINKEYRENPYKFGRFPIKQYKRSMDQYIDKTKKVFCDKSPIFVRYAKQIEQAFSKDGNTVYFILMVRDPNHSRHIKQIDWETLAESQKTNQQRLKNVCFVTYEEMCKDSESVRVKILQMLPELSDFQMSSEISKEFLTQEIPDQPKIRSEMSNHFGYTDKPFKVEKRVNKKEMRNQAIKEKRERRERERREKREVKQRQMEQNNKKEEVLEAGQVLKPGETLEAPKTKPKPEAKLRPEPAPTKETPKSKPKVKVKKRNNKPKPGNNKYLFILCPPFSGSTILYKIINTHPTVSTFIGNPEAVEGQGQGFLINNVVDYEDNRHNSEYELPVEEMKQLFDKHWNHEKPILCDRSPPFVHFANQIEDYFEQFGEVYFLCMIRNPYATRWIEDSSWVRFAREQKHNIETLKNVCWFTYEDLVTNQDLVIDKLNNFLPEFSQGSFDFNAKHIENFNVNDKRCKPISDDFLHRVEDKEEKNELLRYNQHLLDFFGYKYIE